MIGPHSMRIRRDTVPPISLVESIASSAVKTSWDLSTPLIIVVSETGASARLVAKYRPHVSHLRLQRVCAAMFTYIVANRPLAQVPILVITRSRKTAHQVILSRSTIPCLTSAWHGTEEVAEAAIQHAKAAGLVHVGDLIPVVFGRVGAFRRILSARFVHHIR